MIGEFEGYWSEHKQTAFEQLCKDEKIVPERLEKLVQYYVFANRPPKLLDIGKALSIKPKILERKTILARVADKIQDFISTFIEENLPKLQPGENVIGEFEGYWSKHKQTAFKQLCADEKIVPEQLEKLVQYYVFANRLPKLQDIGKALSIKPKILERKTILARVCDKIQNFIDTFIEGMGGSV